MDIETQTALEEDEPAVAAFLKDHQGLLQRDEQDKLRYWLTMTPRSAPTEEYYVCVTWTKYPHAAPSVKFADSTGGSLTVTTAWPLIPGYRPSSFDICKPFTAEGYGIHPDWVTGPEAWPVTGNPFVWVVETLQGDLDYHYSGRSA
ncbi:MAG TPA: hypothetical protein VGQ42_12090 [Candidatus Dormibacteraeota bacterium]|jgi:hypothetical protein|nr:hypothetical protein [Candidatus Dormibacteraeota bacterium]